MKITPSPQPTREAMGDKTQGRLIAITLPLRSRTNRFVFWLAARSRTSIVGYLWL